MMWMGSSLSMFYLPDVLIEGRASCRMWLRQISCQLRRHWRKFRKIKVFHLTINSKRQLGKWRTTQGHGVRHTKGELSKELKPLQDCEERLWGTAYDEAIDKTRSEQRQFSSWKRHELCEDSGHFSTSGLIDCRKQRGFHWNTCT